MGSNRPPPDWKIITFDTSTTEAPETETELKRLTALKSYDLLDQDVTATDSAYQEVVNYMSNTFQGTASLNLVDLERVWTVACSNSMWLEAHREQRRKDCCCAHTVLLKSGVKTLVIPNTANDPRFRTAPTVQGPPYIQFYAGTPLISREGGMKIGTLSVTDTRPRTNWTEQQSDLLVQLASITMQHMEQKRPAQITQQNNSNTTQQQQQHVQPQQSAQQQQQHHPTNMSSQAPSSQSSTFEPTSNNSSSGNLDTTENTATSKSANTNYTALFEDFDNPHKQDGSNNNQNQNNGAHLAPHPTHQNVLQHPSVSISSNQNGNLLQKLQMVGKETPVQIRLFVNLLEEVMQSFPKKVDLLFIVDPSLPTVVVLYDSKVFRAALALLSSACQRTAKGQICLTVYARPRRDESAQKDIVFECEDTGPTVPDLCVDPVVLEHIGPLNNSEYGSRPRILANGGTGSTVWFSLPLQSVSGV